MHIPTNDNFAACLIKNKDTYSNWLVRIDIPYWCMDSHTRKVRTIINWKHVKKGGLPDSNL